MPTPRAPVDVCLSCGHRRRAGADAACARCGEPPIQAVWQRGERGEAPSGIELFLSAVTSGLLLAYALLYALLLAHLAASAASSMTATALFGALLVLGGKLARWLVRSIFDLWGTTWSYRSVDGARWGSVVALRGLCGAGEGVCLTSFQPTRPGATLLCSTDAIAAGLPLVAAHLSRLSDAKGRDAFTPFEVLMLGALAGLVARGDATVSRATATRWRKDWLRAPRRGAPSATYTIQRDTDRDEDAAVEREIQIALQAKRDALSAFVAPPRPGGYREQAPRARTVRVLLEDVLTEPVLAAAGRALRAEPCGGAPVAVAAAIAEFARCDEGRMRHLRLLLGSRGGPS